MKMSPKEWEVVFWVFKEEQLSFQKNAQSKKQAKIKTASSSTYSVMFY